MSRHDPDPDARIAALLMQVDASLDRSRDWIAARAPTATHSAQSPRSTPIAAAAS
jgi:hypothetical protein